MPPDDDKILTAVLTFDGRTLDINNKWNVLEFTALWESLGMAWREKFPTQLPEKVVITVEVFPYATDSEI